MPRDYYLATGNKDLEQLIDSWDKAFTANDRDTLHSICFQLIGYAAAAKKIAVDDRSIFERVFGG